ncbi:short-chain dehydrogenase [Methylobacterium variabile]|jgi:NAD(P)-dependent dehydrogenase (short-subunit alcohol dehydrogenase family)|uniref:Short-chain dehydrogenase n=1 Tax=Methylobacterium variabile TaxID=298794 RepID=A0A0J6RXL3_9HYPH|nr:oxidoreductase [Methylobacterium variabile]KMO27575.1 short-chain dehydrogenase [Methylobacterium variabile]
MPWTTAMIPPQAGRLAIVTGATSGIGYEAALALAGAGAEVVLAARDTAKADGAAAAIRRAHPAARLEIRALDTARLASVRAFASQWRAEGRPIDILLLNAGIAAVPRREETEDGFERQLATNYLGHFALTGLLLPSLRAEAGAPPARVVPVASIAHRSGRIAFDDLQLHRSYAPQAAYRQTKLAMLMFGLELDRRLRARPGAAGPAVRSIPAHPGVAATAIARRGDRAGPLAQRAGAAILGLIGQSAARGALPLLYAATAPEAEGGHYYGPDGLWEVRGHPAPARIEAHARDPQAAGRLWALSETLTGVTYPL